MSNRRMAEILRHRRETRRQTEKTNFCLNDGKAPAYSPTTVLVNNPRKGQGPKTELRAITLYGPRRGAPLEVTRRSSNTAPCSRRSEALPRWDMFRFCSDSGVSDFL